MITEIELSKALKDVLPYVVVTYIDCNNRHCAQPCCISCFGPENAQADASEASVANSRACKVLREWENAMPIVRKPGCNCDPDDWFDAVIPPVCDEYAEGGDEYCDYCNNCEHNKECHQLKQEQPESSSESLTNTNMTMNQLINQLVTDGGAIVSSGDCSQIEIANAQSTGRFTVRDDGMGFVRRTKGWLALQLAREKAHPNTNGKFFT